jgi:type IV pilus assembly protein PilM
LRLFRFLSRQSVGLDIQPEGICLVQLEKKGGRYSIKHHVAESLPVGLYHEGRVVDWARLSACLKRFVKAQCIDGASVAFALPVHLLKMQQVILPEGICDDEIKMEIEARLLRETSEQDSAWCVDFALTSRQQGYIEVLFAAMPQEELSRYISCLQSAGLQIKIIDVDIFAIKRAVTTLFSKEITDINAGLTFLNETRYLQAYGLAMRDMPIW